MFGGYDVAAYLMEEDNTLIEEEVPVRLLPCYNTSPLTWVSVPDVILVAEFSEHEGPKPLHLIPTNGAENFDENKFAVKIMAVDCQAAKSGSFSVSEDMQIMLMEDTCDSFALVHHFTLYDTQARGFVRPFCMAYITKDKRKLLNHFTALSNHFKKVCDVFHFQNKKLFTGDLRNCISNLRFTRELFVRFGDGHVVDLENVSHDIFEGVSLNAIDNLLSEACSVLQTVNPIKESAGRNFDTTNADNISADDTVSEAACMLHTDHKPKVVNVNKWRRFDKELRSMNDLCLDGADKALLMLVDVYKNFNQSLLSLDVGSNEFSSLEQQQAMVNFRQINRLPQKTSGINVKSMSKSMESQESYESAEDCLVSSLDNSSAAMFVTPTSTLTDDTQASSLQSKGSLGSFIMIDTENKYEDTEFGKSLAKQNLQWPRSSSTVCNIQDISSFDPLSPGFGLMKYLGQYGFTINVIYALLCGCTVGVCGSSKKEEDLRGFVQAVSLFVPDCHGQGSVYDCINWPRDLAPRVRLFGYIRVGKDDIPSTKTPVIEVDIDKKICSAPLYKTGILTNLNSKRKHLKYEATFIAYIHSLLLELTMKVFILWQSPKDKDSSSFSSDKGLEKFNLSVCDAKIVQGMMQQQLDSSMKL